MTRSIKTNSLPYNALISDRHIQVLCVVVLSVIGMTLLCRPNRSVYKEPFMNEVNRAVRNVENVGKQVKKIPGDIRKIERKMSSDGKNISKTIDNKLKKFLKQVETLVTKKIKAFVTSFLKSINGAVIQPLNLILRAFYNMFLQVFSILTKIGDKIKSLPDCAPYYGVVGTYVEIRKFWKRLLPNFLWKAIEKVGNFLQPVLNAFGYKKIKKRCYDFNVNKEINSINTGFETSANEFVKNFGNFKGIKV